MSRRVRWNKAIHFSSLGLTLGLADLGDGYFVPLPIPPTTSHVWNVTSTINDQPAQPWAPPTNGHNGLGVFYPPWSGATKSSGNRLWYSAKRLQPAGSDQTATTFVSLRRFTHFDGQSCPTSVSKRLPGGLCSADRLQHAERVACWVRKVNCGDPRHPLRSRVDDHPSCSAIGILPHLRIGKYPVICGFGSAIIAREIPRASSVGNTVLTADATIDRPTKWTLSSLRLLWRSSSIPSARRRRACRQLPCCPMRSHRLCGRRPPSQNHRPPSRAPPARRTRLWRRQYRPHPQCSVPQEPRARKGTFGSMVPGRISRELHTGAAPCVRPTPFPMRTSKIY
jgi:hypothetical protein